MVDEPQSIFTATECTEIQRLLPAALATPLIQATDPSPLLFATTWLRERIIALSRFVPAPVVRHHLQGGQADELYGAIWSGSLLFADLSGFTALSEHLASLGKEGSEEITRIINRLFEALVAQIELHGGDLIKFGGDALTAFFNADLLGPNHAAWAAGAAQAMQATMQQIGTVQTRLGEFVLRLRIGVHSGQAFAAFLGDAQHQEVLLTGPDVNHVARAQEIAAPGEVVLSLSTLEQLAQVVAQPREAGFAAVQELTIPPPPGQPVAFQYPPDTNDRGELLELLRVYAALRCFLPQNLTERQLLEADDLATGGIRLVTIVFAHIAPFSAILPLYPDAPAEIAALLNHYYARMQQIVIQFGGAVNKLDMAADGDKLLAIFGAPLANENDAELAIRAALAMQTAMNEVNAVLQITNPTLPLLEQQIGINQGHVFAGLVGSAQRREYTVMGDPVNLAARLMVSADYGDILVSPAISRATSDLFAFESLPPIMLKGKSLPVEPARITRVYHTRREIARAPLVGRRKELDRLCELGTQALSGNGQIAVVKGEPGIGKSRLVEELLQWLTLASLDPTKNVPSFNPLTVEGQFYEQTTPYAAARDLLRQVLRLSGAPDDQALAQLVVQRIAAMVPELARFTPLMSSVLGVDLEESTLTSALTPEQRHDRTLDLLEAIFEAAARQSPLIIVWDDVHWIDASSHELIVRLSRQIDTRPFFLVLCYRPDPPLEEIWNATATSLTLDELDDHERLELASAMIGGSPVPPELQQHWASDNDTSFNPQGNPFFIEEVMRELIDQRVIVELEEGGWQLKGNLNSLPGTIEGVITARLDRLAARYRETVQLASVIGRRFQLDLLDGITHNAELPEHMQVLTSADLIAADHLLSEMAYLFKHTLTRDVAYEGILYARRRDLHRRVAQAIESIYPDKLDEFYPVLARHYARAEDWPSAIHYYLAAGRQAQAGYFNQEAIAHFQTALELLPNHAADPNLLIELHERLGYVQLQAGAYPAALESLNQALELSYSAEVEPDAVVRILRHIATVHERKADFNAASNLISEALFVLGKHQSIERVRILLLGAGLHYRQGRYKQAIEWAERGLVLAQRLQSIQDEAHAYDLLSLAYRELGELKQAIIFSEKSINLYKKSNRIGKLADAYNNLAIHNFNLGKLQTSIEYHNQAYVLRSAINDVYGIGMTTNNMGDIHTKLGLYDQAIKELNQSLTVWISMGSLLGMSIVRMNLGVAYLMKHDYSQAQNFLIQSEEQFTNMGAQGFLAEVYRHYAILQLNTENIQQALKHCYTSMDYATKLQNKLDQGLAYQVLGRILYESGKGVEAIEALEQALLFVEECNNQQEMVTCLDLLARYTPQDDEQQRQRYNQHAIELRLQLEDYQFGKQTT